MPSPDREIVCVVVVQGEGGEVTDLKSPKTNRRRDAQLGIHRAGRGHNFALTERGEVLIAGN
ncbi:MAG: hypothetical protein VCA38_20445, partial [Roseibacillus sp.]